MRTATPFHPYSSRTRGRQRALTASALLLSTAAHALLIWGVADWRPRADQPAPPRVVEVRLISLPAPVAVAAAPATPPAPAPAPAAATPAPVVQAKPVPQPVSKPAKVRSEAPRLVRKTPKPVSPIAPPAPAPAAPTMDTAPTEAVALAPAAAPSSTVAESAITASTRQAPAISAPDPDALAHYRDALGQHLAGLQRYPRVAAMRGWEGEVVVRMVVARKGQLVSARVLQSSGYSVLDESALQLVRDAGPLPPPPNAGDGELEITVPVRYRLRRQS